MPLVAYECKCGVQYDDLEGMGYESSPCPQCGSLDRKAIPSTCAFKGDFRPEHMDPVEREMILDNRKMHERMILTGARDSGEMNVKESGPDWTRPFGNNEFARKKAIEENKLVNPSGNN